MAEKKPTYEQIETALKHRNFSPLYFLYGVEHFLIDRLQQLIIAGGLEAHERDFNLDIVYGSDANAQQVLALCSSFPVMAERRVVVVRDFEKVQENQLLAAYARQPNPTAIVAFVCRDRPDLRTEPYRSLSRLAVSCECKAVRPAQMASWIGRQADSLGLEIEDRAAHMLADYVGTDLHTAASEIQKLQTFVGEGNVIKGEDVIVASGQTREYNVFELQKAIGETRAADALKIAEQLLQQSANPRGEAIRAVTVLSSYFTKLWKLTKCQSDRLPPSGMAQRIGVPPYFIREYLQSLRYFDPESIRRSLRMLLAADFEMKGGSTRNETLVMSLLIDGLMAEAGGRPAVSAASRGASPV
jgi:DNA polymerase-3 subunit delta